MTSVSYAPATLVLHVPLDTWLPSPVGAQLRMSQVPDVGELYSKSTENAQTCGSFDASATRSPVDASRIFTVPESALLPFGVSLLLFAQAGAIERARESASVATPAPSSARRVGLKLREGRGWCICFGSSSCGSTAVGSPSWPFLPMTN